MLKITELSKRYEDGNLAWIRSLEVKSNEIFALLGATVLVNQQQLISSVDLFRQARRCGDRRNTFV